MVEAVKRTNGLDLIVIDYDPLAIETGIDDPSSAQLRGRIQTAG
jgi:hypothetical protein